VPAAQAVVAEIGAAWQALAALAREAPAAPRSVRVAAPTGRVEQSLPGRRSKLVGAVKATGQASSVALGVIPESAEAVRAYPDIVPGVKE